MAYKINSEMLFGPSISIPCDVIDSVIKMGSSSSLKILLWIFRYTKKELNAEEISFELNMNLSDVVDSLEFLLKANVIYESEKINRNETIKEETEKPKARKTVVSTVNRPHYQRTEVVKMIEKDNHLSQLIDLAQQLFGKGFTNADLDSLAALYDYYGLSSHYIVSAIEYCASIGKKGMGYIESVCVGWINFGINDDNIDQHIDILRKQNRYEDSIRKEFGIYDRVFTPKEKEYIRTWFENYAFPIDMIKLAYDKTIDSTGKVTLSYINTILSKWFKKKIFTIIEAENDSQTKKTNKNRTREDRNQEYEALAKEYND